MEINIDKRKTNYDDLVKRGRARIMSKYSEIIKRNFIDHDTYHKWLSIFSNKYPYFNDAMFGKLLFDAADFENCSIDRDDYFAVSRLYLLFSAVNEFYKEGADPKTIVSDKTSTYYYFTSENTKYKIGYELWNNEFVHCCYRLNDKFEAEFIDIKDIRKKYFDKELKKQQQLMLQKLRVEVKNLLGYGCLPEDITNIIEEEIKEAKTKKLSY